MTWTLLALLTQPNRIQDCFPESLHLKQWQLHKQLSYSSLLASTGNAKRNASRFLWCQNHHTTIHSGENTELKCSPFKAWSRSIYSHTCYAYCQGFLPCLFLPFRSIRLHFFQNLSRFFLCWLWLTQGSCVGPQNKIDHLPEADSRVECPRNVNRL